jgi:hypothetical protein
MAYMADPQKKKNVGYTILSGLWLVLDFDDHEEMGSQKNTRCKMWRYRYHQTRNISSTRHTFM